MKKVSVIIGFRDWGLDRLRLSIKSIWDSFDNPDEVEIVISDFGSENPEINRKIIESLGAQYHFTESKVWSRSRALNAGIAITETDYVMCTDADMLFAPGTLQTVADELASSETGCYYIQCRDLPRKYNAESIAQLGFSWQAFDATSTLRPRWGMGGLVGFRRDDYDGIRGFDERMHTYGGEDLDFASRMQKMGHRAVWLEDPRVRMFHIWHPSSRVLAEGDAKTKDAVAKNKKIVNSDPTVIRNLDSPTFFRARNPLISVVISTFNRADLIGESISSVLAQSFEDFELIIVDDGSTDDTQRVVKNFNDKRIRYFYQGNSGISAARNLGTQMARGKYIAVHDDDDLMLPSRLRSSLTAIRAGIRASFGSWINFNDDDGGMQINVSRKTFDPNVVWGVGPAPGHATWLVEKELMEATPYDEALTSAVDHNVATRIASSSVHWAHTGAVLFMRRKHQRQVSESDESRQTGAALLTRRWTTATKTLQQRDAMSAEGKSAPYPKVAAKDNLKEFGTTWLSDHLVNRKILIHLRGGQFEKVESALSSVLCRAFFANHRGDLIAEILEVEEVSWSALAVLKKHDIPFTILESSLEIGNKKSYNTIDLENHILCHVFESISNGQISLEAKAVLVVEGVEELEGLQPSISVKIEPSQTNLSIYKFGNEESALSKGKSLDSRYWVLV